MLTHLKSQGHREEGSTWTVLEEQKHPTVLSVHAARQTNKHQLLAELPCGMDTLHEWRAQSNDGLLIRRYRHHRAHTICT